TDGKWVVSVAHPGLPEGVVATWTYDHAGRNLHPLDEVARRLMETGITSRGLSRDRAGAGTGPAARAEARDGSATSTGSGRDRTGSSPVPRARPANDHADDRGRLGPSGLTVPAADGGTESGCDDPGALCPTNREPTEREPTEPKSTERKSTERKSTG
ncbi:MAG: hypothetical protein ACKOW5_11240, partial [Actinomycetales bacterium]